MSDKPEEKDITPAAEGSAGEEIEALRTQLARLQADFENYKRRSGEETARNSIVARLSVILELLPVIDNFERAFKDVPEKIRKDSWYQGITAIKQQFEQVLKRLGIEHIKSVGEAFDPALHEAIVHEPSKTYPADIISEEFEAGYRIGDDVIRHSKVKVSNGKKK